MYIVFDAKIALFPCSTVLLMSQFLWKSALDTYKVRKHNNHTVYGIKGGITAPKSAWQANFHCVTKLISPAVKPALDL